MDHPEGPRFSYPSLWLDSPAPNGVKRPRRRCHQAAKEECTTQACIGQPDGMISLGSCTNDYTDGIVWLDTARPCSAKRPAATPSENARSEGTCGLSGAKLRPESSALAGLGGRHSDWDEEELTRPLHNSSQPTEGCSRSNQPPRLIDQTRLSFLNNQEPDERAQPSLSSELTGTNSSSESWLKDILDYPTSDVLAVQQEMSQIGSIHHRSLFQTTTPCPLNRCCVAENVTEVMSAPMRPEKQVKLSKIAASSHLTAGQSHLSLHQRHARSPRQSPWHSHRDCRSPRSLLCAQLGASACTEKERPGQSDCEDIALLKTSKQCYGIGSISRTDDTSARCIDGAKLTSEALFSQN